MTRQGRECRELVGAADGYEQLFAALFQTAAKIENITADDLTTGVTSLWIIARLYYDGVVCRHKPTGLWLQLGGEQGVDVYGKAVTYRLNGANGFNITAPAADVELYRASPDRMPVCQYVRQKCALIADIDNAIAQNLDAVKQMTVLDVDDQALAKKMRDADARRRKGASVYVLEHAARKVGDLTALKTGADYLVDRLQDARRKEYEDLLHYVGVFTPTEKGERLITSEVSTQNAETNAYTGIVARTFNADAEANGSPVRFVLYSAGQDPATVYEEINDEGGANYGDAIEKRADDVENDG